MQASLRSLRMLGCDATPSRRMRRPPILLRVTGLSLTDHNRRHTLGLLPSPLWGGVGGGGSAYGNVANARLLPPEHLTSAQADDPVIAGLCREAPLLP